MRKTMILVISFFIIAVITGYGSTAATLNDPGEKWLSVFGFSSPDSTLLKNPGYLTYTNRELVVPTLIKKKEYPEPVVRIPIVTPQEQITPDPFECVQICNDNIKVGMDEIRECYKDCKGYEGYSAFCHYCDDFASHAAEFVFYNNPSVDKESYTAEYKEHYWECINDYDHSGTCTGIWGTNQTPVPKVSPIRTVKRSVAKPINTMEITPSPVPTSNDKCIKTQCGVGQPAKLVGGTCTCSPSLKGKSTPTPTLTPTHQRCDYCMPSATMSPAGVIGYFCADEALMNRLAQDQDHPICQYQAGKSFVCNPGDEGLCPEAPVKGTCHCTEISYDEPADNSYVPDQCSEGYFSCIKNSTSGAYVCSESDSQGSLAGGCPDQQAPKFIGHDPDNPCVAYWECRSRTPSTVIAGVSSTPAPVPTSYENCIKTQCGIGKTAKLVNGNCVCSPSLKGNPTPTPTPGIDTHNNVVTPTPTPTGSCNTMQTCYKTDNNGIKCDIGYAQMCASPYSMVCSPGDTPCTQVCSCTEISYDEPPDNSLLADQCSEGYITCIKNPISGAYVCSESDSQGSLVGGCPNQQAPKFIGNDPDNPCVAYWECRSDAPSTVIAGVSSTPAPVPTSYDNCIKTQCGIGKTAKLVNGNCVCSPSLKGNPTPTPTPTPVDKSGAVGAWVVPTPTPTPVDKSSAVGAWVVPTPTPTPVDKSGAVGAWVVPTPTPTPVNICKTKKCPVAQTAITFNGKCICKTQGQKIIPSLTMTFVPITNITFSVVDLSSQWSDKQVGSQSDNNPTGPNCYQVAKTCKRNDGSAYTCYQTVCS